MGPACERPAFYASTGPGMRRAGADLSHTRASDHTSGVGPACERPALASSGSAPIAPPGTQRHLAASSARGRHRSRRPAGGRAPRRPGSRQRATIAPLARRACPVCNESEDPIPKIASDLLHGGFGDGTEAFNRQAGGRGERRRARGGARAPQEHGYVTASDLRPPGRRTEAANSTSRW